MGPRPLARLVESPAPPQRALRRTIRSRPLWSAARVAGRAWAVRCGDSGARRPGCVSCKGGWSLPHTAAAHTRTYDTRLFARALGLVPPNTTQAVLLTTPPARPRSLHSSTGQYRATTAFPIPSLSTTRPRALRRNRRRRAFLCALFVPVFHPSRPLFPHTTPPLHGVLPVFLLFTPTPSHDGTYLPPSPVADDDHRGPTAAVGGTCQAAATPVPA